MNGPQNKITQIGNSGKKACGPLVLTFLPFTLSLGTLWTFSRVVTKIELIPKSSNGPMFKMVRLSAIMGKPKENFFNIYYLVKSKNTLFI